MKGGPFVGTLLASCAIAFSTYSRLPMPQVAWSEKNMRYTLAFFPLVGAAVGLVFWGADALCGLLGAGTILRAALRTAAPIIVTGGIHLDGYCDTVDALASHAPREKKLAILKDSSAGAFAVIWCGVWFLLTFALMSELESVSTLAAGFVLSRTLSAQAVEQLPSARPVSGPGAGMGSALKAGSRLPRWVLPAWLCLYCAALPWLNRAAGLAALVCAVGFWLVYKRMAVRQFGGFTGDLAGWFLQVCELVMLAAVVAAERMCALWC